MNASGVASRLKEAGVAFVILVVATLLTVSSATSVTPADPWEPIRFLQGTWQRTSEGEPGRGTVERSYAFVLKDRFIHERNISTYPPQPANKSGEVHEHWGFFSHDRDRDVLVLRQFHQEGFVNQFAMTKSASTAKKLVFDSENFENLGTWRGRETYDIISNDEFIETFELGRPGKPLQLYSRNHFKRVAR
jgi:hypothetical protein